MREGHRLTEKCDSCSVQHCCTAEKKQVYKADSISNNYSRAKSILPPLIVQDFPLKKRERHVVFIIGTFLLLETESEDITLWGTQDLENVEEKAQNYKGGTCQGLEESRDHSNSSIWLD